MLVELNLLEQSIDESFHSPSFITFMFITIKIFTQAVSEPTFSNVSGIANRGCRVILYGVASPFKELSVYMGKYCVGECVISRKVIFRKGQMKDEIIINVITGVKFRQKSWDVKGKL